MEVSVMKFQVRSSNLGRLLPKILVKRIFGYFVKWDNSKLTKIGPFLDKQPFSYIIYLKSLIKKKCSFDKKLVFVLKCFLDY